MFLNLVRINLMRLYKNRFNLAGAVINLLMAASIVWLYCIFLSDQIDTIGVPFFWEVFLMIVYLPIVSIVAMIKVLYFSCDYYSYRQMVNIRGVCRSEIKFCFSELVSIGIFTLSESLWGMMIILIGAFYDTPHFSLFDQYPITIVIVWLALSLGLFFSCLLIYDICRFAHTKKYSLIALGTIAAVFFVVVGIASKFIFDEAMMLLGSIALPSFVFSALVMDEGTGYEIGFVLFVVGLYFAILIASAIISCFRRYEL